MTRDEVLAALSRAEVDYVKVQAESQTVWEFQEAEWKAKALRAAAEIIRESGWRPIAEAPEWQSLIVGVWGERVGADGATVSHEWFVEAFQMKKDEAIREGYTHYLPEPEPPAREVENG